MEKVHASRSPATFWALIWLSSLNRVLAKSRAGMVHSVVSAPGGSIGREDMVSPAGPVPLAGASLFRAGAPPRSQAVRMARRVD